MARTMAQKHPDERLLAEALAESAGSEGAEELSPEEALAYLEGRLGPEEEARVARLAAANPEVSRMLLDLADFAAAPAERKTADVATHAAWRQFQTRLPAAKVPSRRFSPWLAAAALALLSLGLGWRVWQLEGARRRPVVNLANLELSRDRAGEAEVVVGAADPVRVVISPRAVCAAYGAAFQGPAGERQSLAGLVRNARGQLTLLVFLAPGEWELSLSCDGATEPETFRFDIRRGDAD